MTSPLLPTRFLFRFSAPCRYHKSLWTDEGARLDEKDRLVGLAELEERTVWADVRAAWSEAGLAFSVHVQGKSQPPWCRAGRVEDSDGLQIWIDTRDVHNVHRAGRFCHRFIFLPSVAGIKAISPISAKHPTSGRRPEVGRGKLDPSPFSQAMSESLPINRARELPQPVREGLLKSRCQQRTDGYVLEVFIPAEALTGFDPAEHPRLGFTYAVVDRELGVQTFGVGSPMPYQEDPSLWATLELQR
jgi:hypothetical protein